MNLLASKLNHIYEDEHYQQGIDVIFTCASLPQGYEQWEEMSEDIQKAAVQSLMDASEYDNAVELANEAITEAVGRYLHDAMIEKEQRQEGNDPT
jgi:hypothetical protein